MYFQLHVTYMLHCNKIKRTNISTFILKSYKISKHITQCEKSFKNPKPISKLQTLNPSRKEHSGTRDMSFAEQATQRDNLDETYANT